jgi:uncharacterized protein (DUF427 family)
VSKKQAESVWDYPRPPRVEFYEGLIEIDHGGYVVAKSSSTYRVLETSHPRFSIFRIEMIMLRS